jgi:hypothetical protein
MNFKDLGFTPYQERKAGTRCLSLYLESERTAKY